MKKISPFLIEKCCCLVSAVLHWIAHFAFNGMVFYYPGQKLLVHTFFSLLSWHGWLVYVNWCASLYKGRCDQGQTRNFLPYRSFSVCCCCIEAWYGSRWNCCFNSVFTNCLLTPATSSHWMWLDVTFGVQLNALNLNYKFSLPRQGFTSQDKLPSVTAGLARRDRIWSWGYCNSLKLLAHTKVCL